MPVNQRRYPKEEIARRGDALYDEKIAPQLGADAKGKYLAIDIETGEWELDPDWPTATGRLRARIPDAQVWLKRFGSRYVTRMRSCSLKLASWPV
jgi:hypothetical protein